MDDLLGAAGGGGTPEPEPPPRRPAPRPAEAGPPLRRRGRAFRRPVGPLAIGESMAKTLSVAGRHLPFLLPLALLFHGPAILWSLRSAERVWERLEPAREMGYAPGTAFWAHVAKEEAWLGRALTSVLPLALQAIVTVAVFETLAGHGLSYGRSVVEGLRRMGWAVLAALVGALLLGLTGFAVAMVAGVFVLASPWLAILVLLAFLGVVVTIFFPYVQVAVVERSGPFRALARAAHLTERFRWKVFAFLVVFVGVGLVARTAVQLAVFSDPGALDEARTAVVLHGSLGALVSALGAVASAVLYHDLRRAKEGVGVDELLEVFR